MRAPPLPPRAALFALAASLIAHAALLGDARPLPDAAVAPARAVELAWLPPAAAPVVLPEPVG